MHHASGLPGDLEPWEHELIRHEVRSFRIEQRFRWSDEDDLFQDCAERWLTARGQYDAARGANLKTFMKRVVRNRLKDEWKAQRTESRRGHREAKSLDEPVFDRDNEDATRAELIRDQHEPLADVASANLDIARAAARLSDRQRRVLAALLRDYSVDGIAAIEFVNRETVYEDRKRIQEACRDVGLAPRTDPAKRRPRS